MTVVAFLKRVVSFVLHVAALAALYVVLRPVFTWYLAKVPLLGVDLYYSATYGAYQLRNFSLPFNSFKDIWFAGYPLFRDLFQLYFYLMVPFIKDFGLIEGIKLYVVAVTLGFAASCYFLFYQLGRNIVLGLLLTILVLFSVNVYGAMIWGGSLPYYSSQLFFPLCMGFLVYYRRTGEKRWFYLSALLAGLGINGHPMPIIAYVFPGLFLVSFLWISGSLRAHIKKAAVDVMTYLVLVVLLGARMFYPYLANLVYSIFHGQLFGAIGTLTGVTPASTSLQTEGAVNFSRTLIPRMLEDSEGMLLPLLALGGAAFGISLLMSKRTKRIVRVLPFALLCFYVWGHVVVNANGIPLLSQGWYRAFWAFPVTLGALAASLWGGFFQGIEFTLPRKGKVVSASVSILVTVIFSLVFGGIGVYFVTQDHSAFFEKMDLRSEVSSAFPEVLSIRTGSDDLEELRQELVPPFLDPNDKNWRLYTADAAVNIWWNALYPLPLARGYIDPPLATSQRWGLFWLDLAIAGDSLVRDFAVPREDAYYQTLYLIDWYGIRYFEGGRAGSKGPSVPPSSYLLENEIFDRDEERTVHGAILKYQTESGKPELHMEVPQSLRFLRVADEFASPILAGTQAPAILFFGDSTAYEDFSRVLGTYNLNSRFVIPVYGGKEMKGLSEKFLEPYSAVVASSYSIGNGSKVFDELDRFVRQGGGLFIDTGGDTKEANSIALPYPLPITTSQQEEMGRLWDFSATSDPVFDGVTLSGFGPPVYQDSQWKLAVPVSDADIREGAKVLLTHQGKPVLVEQAVGEGKVFWSGINLLYHHNQYKSRDEAQLFKNILTTLLPMEEHAPVLGTATWDRPETVRLELAQAPKGILFKEEGYAGWSAVLEEPHKQRLPISLTGPTAPGFMYIPLPQDLDGPVRVLFRYRGTPEYWFFELLSLLTALLLIDQIVLGGRVVCRRLPKLHGRFLTHAKGWWEKEE